MDRALWLLLRLRFGGWLRRLRKSFGSLKGILLCVAGSVVFMPMILSAFFAPRGMISNPEIVRRVGQLGLLVYTVLSLVTTGTGDRAITFSPAEIAFLFPAPFRQRQLLAYKIVFATTVCVLTVPFLSVFLLQHATSFAAGMVGLSLSLLFLQFFAMAVGLATDTIGVMAYNRRRKAVVLGLLVVVGLLAAPVAREVGQLRLLQLLARVEHSWTVQVLLMPFRPFMEAFTAPRLWPDLVVWGAIGLAIDAALVVFIFALDAQYLERSATVSAKIYTRLERARRTGGIGMIGGSKPARFSLPMFPDWGGIGPIAWRQFATAKRDIARLIIFMLIFAPMFVPMLFVKSPQPQAVLALGFQTSILAVTMFLTMLVPFDFRGDLDRMAELKVLPIHPMALAIGQVVAPVVVITALQWVFLILAGVFLNGDPYKTLAFLAFTAPANLLMIGMENLLFLLFPIRLVATNAVDIQAMGRAMVAMFSKLICTGLTALLVVALGAGVYYLTSANWPATLVAAWLVLCACTMVLMRLVGWAFERFDVSRDVPT